MQVARLLIVAAVVAACVGVGFVAFAWRGAETPIDPPRPGTFQPALVAQGANLAAIGNCVTCHTAAGGVPFAGGRRLVTPYGTIVSTNITPDADTGIGHWSQAAFRRAVRDGVDQSGDYLYPAFPYDHFAGLRDDDIGALYAFVMTRTPVRRVNEASQLPFPLSQRILLAGWNLLFLSHQAPIDRGAYLVEGVGHCGACHTPRNLAGAEEKGKALQGAAQDGWWAPGLGAHAQAPVPWTADQMVAYLREGEDKTHGASAGPMQAVTHNLSTASADDVRAMAAYIVALAPHDAPRTARPSPTPASAMGTMLFAGSCAICHVSGAPSGTPPLADSTTLRLDAPDNFLHLVLEGRHAPDGTSGAFMPGFATALTDTQIEAVANGLRDVNGLGPWTGVAARAHELRSIPEESP